MKIHLPLLFTLSLVLLVGCVSMQYVKRGVKYEQAGMNDMAAEMYYQAILANPRNVDAGIGLNRAGQQLLDALGDAVGKAYISADDRTTVYRYLEAKEYFNKVKATGITLNFPPQALNYYNEARVRYLNRIFDEARLFLEDEKFNESEALFAEIKRIDPNFQGVDDHMRVSQCEPVYRKGMEFLAKGLYRSAYGYFNSIIIAHGTYKDAIEMRDEALSQGMLTISIETSDSRSKDKRAIALIDSKIARELSGLDNPFIRVVDTKNTDRFISQQSQGLTRGANIQIGQLLTAKAVLNGTIVKLDVLTGNLQRIDKRGYLKEEVKIKTKSGEEKKEVKYHKVVYQEYRQESSVTLTYKYQLSSIETGEMLVSDVITLSDSDNIHYADFTGNKSNLLPGYWEVFDQNSPKDKVEDTNIAAREIESLLSARRSLKSADSIQEELMEVIGKRVAQKISRYNPEM